MGHAGLDPVHCSLSSSLRLTSSRPPRVLETLEVQKAPSHTLSPHSPLDLIAFVSRENFSFWSVCVFPAVGSVTHCSLTTLQRLRHSSSFIRECRWAILPPIMAGVSVFFSISKLSVLLIQICWVQIDICLREAFITLFFLNYGTEMFNRLLLWNCLVFRISLYKYIRLHLYKPVWCQPSN